ncbi:MAG TPA: OpcA/G6PD domain-containing protein, partial [Acidimicrobiia bacterium]|nr:OpcA/G6PD domain-containing protein [Acidimicrobiia bacterium]
VRALVVVDRDGGWPAPALRSLVEASVRGDVPLVLWRPAGLPDASDPVLGWAEHLVVDSRTVLSVAGVVDLAGRMPVTDLAWVALAQWRELVAGLFDGPDRGPFLADVRHVRVQGHEALQPLLAGWLLSRLRIPAGVVEVGPSEGLSVEVTAEHNGRQGHFSVAWSAESHLIDARVVIGTGPPQVRRWRRDEAGPVGLLGRALARLGWDPVYGEALTAALVLRAESARRSGPGPT